MSEPKYDGWAVISSAKNAEDINYKKCRINITEMAEGWPEADLLDGRIHAFTFEGDAWCISTNEQLIDAFIAGLTTRLKIYNKNWN